MAASKAAQINGVLTVTNNLTVHPIEATSAPPSDSVPPPPPPQRATLTGAWTGTFTTCAQGQSNVRVAISQSGPDDITAAVEVTVPDGAPGTFVAHAVLNTMNNFLSLQFSGWQHQPPGFVMGNIGGYVMFTNDGPASFSGIVKSPGCGQITLKKQ
jgi:hypothetical protein